VGPLPSDDDANTNRNDVEMEDLVDEVENGEDDCAARSGADRLSVMYPPCQDPMLVKIYQGLPTLPCVASVFFVNFAKLKNDAPSSRLCEVKSFMGSAESLCTPFKDSCANLSKSEIGYASSPYLLCFLTSDTLHNRCRSFLKALTFCQSGQHVNTARIDPALLYVENSRLRIKGKKNLAVCVMTGTLTESYLVGSTEAGPRHSPYLIHKVSIAPLEQEMRRDASAWGLLFDFRVITGMASQAGFGFATRGEGKGDQWSNGTWYSAS